MKILVCISHVPDTTSKINFTENDTKFDTNGVQFVINPYDEFSLTRAMWFKEKQGASVTVVNVGNASTEPTLRKALAIGADAAVRVLASKYPYDNFADEGHAEDITLRSSTTEVNEALEKELAERLDIAGIEVMESRIGYLAYANEIASAMLKRQQATAIVAARHKIVEGAVSMVEMALNELSKKNIVDLDDDKKAAMVSNLMVILCSDKDATPVVNAGTLNT